ncbi:ribonuclease H-like domain-containing protein [Tanacetum coccineum]
MQFLIGLDDVFRNVRSSILITEPLPDVKSAFATLSRDESHRANNVHSVNKSSSTAFVSKMGYPPGFKKNPKGNNSKATVNNVTDSGSSSGNTHVLTSDDYQKLMGLLRSSDSGTACGIGNVTCIPIGSNMVSQHMTYSTMFLFNVIDVSHLNLTVAHPNATVANINQIGSVKLTETLIIHDVFIVYGYHVSLLSVHKLDGANKVNVIFNDVSCLIRDSTQKSLVGTGNMVGGLYFLDQGKKHINSSVKTCVVSKCLWHNRVGHPADQVLKVLKDKINIDDLITGPCDVYHKAKKTREPFPLSSHKTNDLGQLVHLDVWGPYNVRNEGDPERVVIDEFVRRSSRKTSLPSRLKDYEIQGKVKYGLNRYVNYAKLSSDNNSFVTNLNKTVEPKTYKEASTNSRWAQAMNKEIKALYRNETWEITDLPKERKPIGSKWIFKIKFKSSGEVERYKARLVAKGFSKKEGLDYEETFSPVVKMVTVRCVLSIAFQNSWSIFQLDVNNTFMYGDLVEDVYMSLPKGFFVHGDQRVCKLKKSLYGLKQAPRKWNEKLSSVLCELGFNQSKNLASLIVVHKLSQAMHGPLKSDFKLAFRVLRYLKGAPRMRVMYKASDSFELTAFIDSDWVKCNVTRRFVTGFAVFLDSCLVPWKSKKQSVLAKSSAEVEYRAMSNVSRKIIWILKILTDLKWNIQFL